MRLRKRKRRRIERSPKIGVALPGKTPSAAYLISPTGAWILCTAVGAAVVLYGATGLGSVSWIGQLGPLASTPLRTEGRPPVPPWVASAPGRAEPVSGEVRIDALVLGRVADILGKVDGRVGQADLLVRLEDEEARARLSAAEAQVALRKRERDAVWVTGPLANRRKAEDAVAAAEQSVATARRGHDRLSAGHASAAALVQARERAAEAQRRLEAARDELARLKADSARLPGSLDAALTTARAELSAAEAQFEKTRIRAPFAGTILQLPVHVGEVVAPSRERPLVVLADISRLRVRAELDERNRDKVFVGQPAHVHSKGFPEAFTGKVAAIAPALVPARAASGGRRRAHEGSVVDVLIDLADPGRLMAGMQVDVFFLAPETGVATSPTPTPPAAQRH